ncbi:hypothetical protein NW768_001228 [Fusarium equiseti]|uniref:Nephrocystin 3-like N-terminal domain-containing protein n=1 Tax=Fusarium equiseti TaxID=61235 RepID=A0ABQ8RPW1_FUSEQ|nr:hypothetical protein NW768_001228 [Fusarium equiseti]
MRFAQPFQSYQPYGSQGAGSEAKKPFSPTVDFSDQSYEMPFFVDVEPSTMKPGGSVARKPLAVQSITNASQSIPKQSPDDRNTKIPQGNMSPVMTKGPEKAPLLPPRKPTFKANPAAFLDSFEFPSMQNFYIEPEAPNPNSHQWLNQDPLFISWKSSKHGLLWLRGSEGCGKSTLMKHTLHSQLKEEPSAIHLTYSFSMCGSELPRSRLGFYKALMHQLIPQSPETLSDVKARFEKIESALPLRQQVAWGAQELYEDLTKAIAKLLKKRSVTIYVDGIDRSEGETAPKLVQDFSKLLEKSQPKPTAKEPIIAHGLKVVFSSTLFPTKDPFPRSHVDVDEKNGSSLAQFLEEQLSTTDFNTRQLVLSKSSSSFISARLIINHIKLFGPAQSSLVQQPSPTPAPISFLLGDYFQNLAQQGNKSLSLLTWCCLTSRPLTLAELRVALSLDATPKLESSKDLLNAEPFSRYNSDESFQSWIKTTSWGLIETVSLRGQRVVKVMHDSISAFFVSKGLDMLSFSSQKPDSPSSPLQRAHHSLATCLLRYLTLLPTEPQWQSRFQTEPVLSLLQYAGTNWSIHILEAGLSKPEASKMLKLLQWPSDSVLSPLVKLDQDNLAIAELQGTLWAHIFAVYGHAPLLSVGIKKAGTEALGLLDTQKRSPLHHAALHGHLAASKQLLKSGVKANARAINGQTALHFAVLQGYQSVLKPLLDSDPSLVSATNEFAQTPLLLAVVRGSSSAVKLLLERKADAKAIDRFNASILHHSVATDKSNVLKLILDGGADINLQDGQGRTALHLAIAENRPAAIKVLFERSCRVDISDKEGKRALHVAAASGNKPCAQELLKQKVAVDSKDVHGQTALVYAVQGLHANLIKLLLEAKADVNMKDKLGFTVLMLAVRANQEKITKLLLEANPDLNALSGEGHTVIYYAVYREKPVPLLSDQEQFVASLLLKHYKKRYSVWDQEWLACKDKFAAEHGKKKKDVDAKSKPKTESKKKTAPSSSSVPPTAARAPKPVKPVDVAKPTANVGAQVTSSKPSPLVAGPQESAKHGPQPGGTTTTQSQTTATTYSPITSGGPAPVTLAQQQQTSKPNTSTSMSVGKQQQQQQTSSFMSYQPSQPTVEDRKQVTPSSGGPIAKPTQPPRPAVVTEQKSPPMNHRNSWAMYSALSTGSPVSSQGTPPAVQNSYFSHSGPSQQPTGNTSFKPFQPFQPDLSHGSSPASTPRQQIQVDHRSSLPSQRSLGQAGQNSPGQQASQQGAAQSYQSFNSNAQMSSASSYQSQASYQSPMDSSIKPVAPLSLGRKPVGGYQPTQPVGDKPTKSSTNNLWQPYQAPAVTSQAAPGMQNVQSGVASPPLAVPYAPPQAAQGKQTPAPGTSQKSMSAQQALPAQKPPSPQQTASNAHAQRPAQAHNPAAQKLVAGQPNPSQMPAPAQQHVATQRPILAKTNQTPPPVQQAAPGRQPVPGQVPPSQKPASAQQPSASQQPAQAPKASSVQKPPSSQKPFSAQQPSAIQKPTVIQAPPGQKSASTQQPAVIQKTAPGQPIQAQKPPPAKQTATDQKPASGQSPQVQKPAPAKRSATDKKPAPGQAPQAQKPAQAQQPASSSKPSSAQKPPPGQQATSDQKKPAPPPSTKTPSQDSSVQKPNSSVPKKPSPSPAQSSGSSQKAQPATGQRSVDTYGSRGMHTQSHDAKNDGAGKSSAGKIAAVTGAGLVAGGAGGYLLSNYYEEHHYENNFVNDERSMNPDQGYYQPVPPPTHTEYYYLQTPAEQSEHSAEESESGKFEDDHQSDDESEADESVSFSVDVSEAEDSDGQALSEDEEDDDLDSISGDFDDGDEVESLNFDEDDSDSLHLATNSTDDENEDENGDESDAESDAESDVEADEDTDAEVSDDEIINRSIQAESDSDNDADLGQNDSDFDEDGAQEVESDQDSDVESQHGNFTGYHEHQTYDEANSDNEEQQGYYGNQHSVEESESEDEVQQTHYHDHYQEQEHFQGQTHYQDQTHYQEQTHFQNQYQQQTFQQEESEEDDQPVHYSNQQHDVNQSDSEDEGEVQQEHYHAQYQQQNQYGQYQQQVQFGSDSESDNESDNDVDGQVDDSDEDENNYGQADSDDDGYNDGGNYTGAGYDSDGY